MVDRVTATTVVILVLEFEQMRMSSFKIFLNILNRFSIYLCSGNKSKSVRQQIEMYIFVHRHEENHQENEEHVIFVACNDFWRLLH